MSTKDFLEGETGFRKDTGIWTAIDVAKSLNPDEPQLTSQFYHARI